MIEIAAERCYMLIIHYRLFFCCSGKRQTPSAFVGVTNCSLKAYLHPFTNQIIFLLLLPTTSSLFPLSFCRFSSFIVPKYSCLLESDSSETCWNRFTFRTAFRKCTLWVTEALSQLKNEWKMLFPFSRPPTQPTEMLFHLPDSARWEILIMSKKVEAVD